MAEGDNDTCALIRARGYAIAVALPGLATFDGEPSAWWNSLDFDEEQLPAVAFLDGGEARRTDTYGHTKPGLAMSVMELTPEVILVENRPKTPKEARLISAKIAHWRRLIVRAYTLDETILSLLGEDGQIEYLTHETDFRVGGSMRGGVKFEFKYSYLFDVDDLT